MPACSFGPHRRPYDPRDLQPIGLVELEVYACPDCLAALSRSVRVQALEQRPDPLDGEREP